MRVKLCLHVLRCRAFAAFEGAVMLAAVVRNPKIFSAIKNGLEPTMDSWTIVLGDFT